MAPRHIDAFHIEQLGKEANRLEEVEAGLLHEQDEVYTLYRDQQRDPWKNVVLRVLNDMSRTELLNPGILKESALREVLAGRARPRMDKRERLAILATRFVRKRLEEHGLPTPPHRLAALYTYGPPLKQAFEARLPCSRSGP